MFGPRIRGRRPRGTPGFGRRSSLGIWLEHGGGDQVGEDGGMIGLDPRLWTIACVRELSVSILVLSRRVVSLSKTQRLGGDRFGCDELSVTSVMVTRRSHVRVLSI